MPGQNSNKHTDKHVGEQRRNFGEFLQRKGIIGTEMMLKLLAKKKWPIKESTTILIIIGNICYMFIIRKTLF